MRKICCYMLMMATAVTTAAIAADPLETNRGEDLARGSEDQGPRGALPETTSILWDNGDHNGTGGRSNATVNAFGARRTLLDDFEIPGGEAWPIGGFHWLHVWGTPGIGNIGTDLEICFHADAGGAPGAEIQCAVTISYMEERTGRIYFSREENVSWSEFESVVLGEGRYWWQATIVGPENNFMLLDGFPVLQDCWVNYDDLGGLQSCVTQFGAGGDFSWQLSESKVCGCCLTAVLVRQPRIGQPLVVDLKIEHGRNRTVTRPFELSIVDRNGTVLATKTTRPFTMEYGTEVNTRQKMNLPRGIGRGMYQLVVSMDGMLGGKRVASVEFRLR